MGGSHLDGTSLARKQWFESVDLEVVTALVRVQWPNAYLSTQNGYWDWYVNNLRVARLWSRPLGGWWLRVRPRTEGA